MSKYSKKIKILYYGDGPQVATGFGTVSKNILIPLHNTGKYDIEVLGINYWGQPHDLPIKTWPVGVHGRDPYGREYVKERILNSDFDILFMVQDSFILEFIGELIEKLKYRNKRFRSLVYFPVDGTPKKSWIQAMETADYPVTYTKYGFNECVKAFPPIGEKLKVIPHGANVEDFYPISYREMFEFKKAYLGPLADRFVITSVNRNQQRKDIPRLMMAFSQFNRRYPDSLLYLHCAVHDQGWQLDHVANSLGLRINQNVVFPHNFGPNQGFPIHILNKIYNISDVVAGVPTGEGWGLFQTEAMATKTPVISPDNTACSEIIGDDRGILVRSGHDLEHYTVLPNDNEVVRPLASIEDTIKAMETLYNDEVLRMRLGENGYKWVTENLIWEKHISPMWEAILDKAAESLEKENDPSELLFDGALEV